MSIQILCPFFFKFIFGCVVSLVPCTGFLQLWRVGATLHCSAQASHWVASLVAEHGLQVCGLQQLWLVGSRAQAQQLWHTGSVAPQHVGSSQTRAQTSVPCIGRQIPNHCTTREAPPCPFLNWAVFLLSSCNSSFCILDASPLSGILFAKIFSHYLFIFLTVNFEAQKFLILISFIFFLLLLCFSCCI